jgi:hypothetical protein
MFHIWILLQFEDSYSAGAVFRIRIHVGLLDPDLDPLVRVTDPVPDPSIQAKIVRKTFISTVF